MFVQYTLVLVLVLCFCISLVFYVLFALFSVRVRLLHLDKPISPAVTCSTSTYWVCRKTFPPGCNPNRKRNYILNPNVKFCDSSQHVHWRIQGGQYLAMPPFQSHALANRATFLVEARCEHDKNI